MRAWLSRLHSAMKDRRGNAAMIMALLLGPAVGAVGLGTDTGIVLMARHDAAAALDAAALSLGASTGTNAELETAGERFFRTNFRDRPGISQFQDFWIDQLDRDTVRIGARVNVSLMFGGVVGIQAMPVVVRAEAKRGMSALLVSLVLDNTGSMWSSGNIGALRDASRDLVDTLFGDDIVQNPNLRVAIVPYAAAVNAGAAANGLVETKPFGDAIPSQNGENWRGCVTERTGAAALADTPAGGGAWWTPFYWLPSLDNAWTVGNPASIDPGPRNSNGLTGPNIGCPTPITPLTNDKNAIDAAIQSMSAWNRGGTLTDIGLAWGRRVLSPGEPFTQSTELDPLNGQTVWASTRWRKAIVLMTDGESQFFKLGGNDGPNRPLTGSFSDVTGYGRLEDPVAQSAVNTTNMGTARDRLNTRIENLCTEIKAQGVIIYTVVFTSGVGQSVRDMYQRCASDPGKFWYAPAQGDLRAAFNQIGAELTRLRLAS